jgi:hypothetical protein
LVFAGLPHNAGLFKVQGADEEKKLDVGAVEKRAERAAVFV